MAKTISIPRAKANIGYLLDDWKSNIKNFDIVKDDILGRFETIRVAGHHTNQPPSPAPDYWMLNTIYSALQKEYEAYMKSSGIGKLYELRLEAVGKMVAMQELDDNRLNRFTPLGNIYLTMKRIDEMRTAVTDKFKKAEG